MYTLYIYSVFFLKTPPFNKHLGWHVFNLINAALLIDSSAFVTSYYKLSLAYFYYFYRHSVPQMYSL